MLENGALTIVITLSFLHALHTEVSISCCLQPVYHSKLVNATHNFTKSQDRHLSLMKSPTVAQTRVQGLSEEHIPLQTLDTNNRGIDGEDAFYVSSDLPYDRAIGTKKLCIAGLVFSVIIGVAFVVIGSLAFGMSHTFLLNPVALEMIPLAINIVVLAITESLGYIHATSLRWALFREGRLEFNANLRLLTFSKRSMANGLVANVLYFITLAICYSGASMVLVRNTYSYYLDDLHGEDQWDLIKNTVSLSKVIPVTVGSAILVQCALSSWCLWTAQIPTWSSNPFTTIKAAAHTGLVRRKGRCMMPVHERNKPAMPTRPRPRQLSPYGISKKVLLVLVISTIVLGVLIIWSGIIIHVGLHNSPGTNWNFIPESAVDQNTNPIDFANQTTMTVFLNFFTSEGPNGGADPVYVKEPTMVGIMAFCVVIQSFLTIGLHCAELQVILQRDEATWRRIDSSEGSPPDNAYNSIIRPLSSVPNIVLLAFKPVIHWLFGSALQVDYAKGLLMRVPHITYLTIAWAFFLGFVALVTYYKPKGLLPASYGHLQTMLDVADDLSVEPMFWKDKGEVSNMEDVPGQDLWMNASGESPYARSLRHSGTSSKRWEKEHIRPEAYYS